MGRTKVRVLWLTNIPPAGLSPELDSLGHFGGSWLTSALLGLTRTGEDDLSVAFPGFTLESRTSDTSSGVAIHALPPNRRGGLVSGPNLARELVRVFDECQPDIVHIHGTEMAHSWTAIELCSNLAIPFVVSIQGVASEIARTYTSGIPPLVLLNPTFRDAVRDGGILGQWWSFSRRGRKEAAAIGRGHHFIGRTQWDEAVVGNLAPSARYFSCPETLRDGFSGRSWALDSATRNSILMTQGSYPIKGLHVVLESLSWLRDEFPGVLLKVAGPDPVGQDHWRASIRRSGYGRFIAGEIRRLRLNDNVLFLGPLSESSMVDSFLSSHVYLSASFMENESNSLSEARALGVPVIASYSGGMASRVEDSVDGRIYPAASPHLLARVLREVLRDDALAAAMGAEARVRQISRSNPTLNSARLRMIYSSVVDDWAGPRS